MKRRRYIGAANKGGIEFTDLSTSNLNAQQAGMVYGDSPTGSINIGFDWTNDSNYANVYLYSVDSNNKIGTAELVNNTIVYVVVEAQGTKYIVGQNNNVVTLSQTANISSFLNSTRYQWRYKGLISGFNLQNCYFTSSYLDFANDYSLSLKTDNTSYSFQRTGALLQGLIGGINNWKIYCNNSDTTIRVAADSSSYTAFLYSYTYSYDFSWETFELEYTYTLSKKHVGTLDSSQNVMMIVKNNTGSAYLVGCSSGTVMLRSVTGATFSGDSVVFSTSTGTGTMRMYSFNAVANGNGYNLRSLYSSSYYLKSPSTIQENNKFTFSDSASIFAYNDVCGLHLPEDSLQLVSIGVQSTETRIIVDSILVNAGTTIVFRYDGSTWSPYYGSLNAGETYAIAVRQAPADPDNPGTVTANYYLVGYDGTEMTHHNFSTFADITITSDCEFAATQGTYGVGLTSNNKGLNVNNEYLAMLDVSADWVYIGDSTTPENSRLWSVVNQTVTYYPEYANSDLEANTSATDTTAECYLVQNGKIQTLVDELVNGETYVIVFVDSGNHYAACVSGTDIVPVLFVDKLPSKLPAAYQFTAETSGQGFLLKQNNQAMGVATNAKLTLGYNAVWTYTGGTTE